MVRMYLSGVLVLAIISLIIAMPLGYNTAIAYNKFIAKELNFNVINTQIPLFVNAGLASILILLPLSTALLPISQSCKVSVKEAISSEKVNTNSQSANFKLSKKLNLSYWISIGFENVFRNRWGTVLTVFNLMLGLALLITSINLKSSITNTFENNMRNQKYSLSVSLEKPYPITELNSALSKTPEVKNAEGWLDGTLTFAQDSVASNPIHFTAFKDNSQLITFQFLKGKLPKSWLKAIVVNPDFMEKYPSIGVGDSINRYANGHINTWKVAGVVKEIGDVNVYTPLSKWEKNIGEQELASDLKIEIQKEIAGSDVPAIMLKIENQLKSKRIRCIWKCKSNINHAIVLTTRMMVFGQTSNQRNLTINATNFKNDDDKAIVNLFKKGDEITKEPYLQSSSKIVNGKAVLYLPICRMENMPLCYGRIKIRMAI